MDAYGLANLIDFAVEALNQVPDDDITGDDDRLVEALAGLNALKAKTRDVEALLQAALTDRFRTQQAQVGKYRLERRGGTTRKQWQSLDVFAALVRRSHVDPETGEVHDPEQARRALVDSVTACVPLTGSLGWRTKALREHGLDPDEYCVTSPAPYRFEVHVVDPGDAEAEVA